MPHEIAEICRNGHVINSAVRTIDAVNPYCHRCGEETVFACENCTKDIRGEYYEQYSRRDEPNKPSPSYHAPAFCYSCGSPFPWTVRQKQAAVEMFIDQVQDKAEQDAFRDNLDEIIKDTPSTALAMSRMAKTLKALKSPIADILTKTVVSLSSDGAKELFGQLFQ